MKTSARAPRPAAAVVGGGISGLIAARELAVAGFTVTVLEASDAFGGCVAAHDVAGLRLDAGAESFATRSTAVVDLLEDLGLDGDVVYPAGSGAWLQAASGARPLPQTGILGIPGDPMADDVRAVIGHAAALRAAADFARPVNRSLTEGDMSLGELVRHRMGHTVLDELVTPVVSGVHSADPDTLDVDAVAPGLRAAVVEHGSLARAVSALRAAAPAGSAVGGIAGGMHRLTAALVEELADRGADLRLGTRVTRIGRNDDGYTLSIGEPDEAVTANRVVVATDGPAAVDLISQLDPDLAVYRPEPGAGVSLVTLVVDRPELDGEGAAGGPRGSGVLVSSDADGIVAKALTHATSKWAWLADEAGPGTHVLRLSYGRLSEEKARIADSDDATLYSTALSDAAALLGVEVAEQDVLGWDVVRYTGALPYATTGHKQRVTDFRAALSAFPSLDAVGGWLSGTGLAAVVADTRARTRISVS
ncbi:protoporphyrinogen oxidase [Zhihengliuella halotolerans]|uniref:Coproporphyrinogen III oxidase n=1 Tax=Zhihengliuella halotolerans TaxID=370736 RepID=A0A4Q8AAA4_9MICC|nr:protoporphyrinogen oxidase [Zhihengliuella halotolerans]RZU61032.1 oxygen-dependent protoporphyrinogen oxidase [Zhihengliuella halotolerans]